MSNYDETTYGDRFAGLYDLLEGPSLDTQGAVEHLGKLAGKGPVLELGVGTARVSLPLAATGIEVHGIEASEAMIEVLREKPGGRDLQVFRGDFAQVDVPPASYSLIFAVYNTFSALRDQESQERCMANVARALAPGGVFVVELSVPDSERLAREQDLSVRYVDADLLVLHASRYDTCAQSIVGQSVVIANGSIQTFPIQVRYTWPAELDLMAKLGGLIRCERWAGWHNEPFDARSKNHVSVYRHWKK